MDMRSLLDQLLHSGKDLAQKGQVFAEQKLGIPEEGERRDSMLSGMKTGAAAAGALAVLLGTQTGRRVTGAAVKVGGLAALGGLAYQMYRQWETSNAASTSAEAVTDTQTSPEILLTAMIAAAKADGHVDSAEMTTIRQKLSELALDGDVNDMILTELTKPLDAASIAALAEGNVAIATEIYLVSAAIIDVANDAEQAYLADLRAALALPEGI
ncbi:DUF533 domain-containing protein [Candidatus Thiothrix anitrata]|jgi:uncharacterized membrane protein YebE (DUF533 family)|uniref:DUF533 domain-containing protein n=1 Tax=Candidatus Thiothrix anitrata TaxID=2823902 RepID=A0ABX7X6Z1_9GAMM|nr:DUF533 domain-containing protein [Candidatus Thiothrix anitrata]QTR49709.1 DUF533 domain-containing protein [Candidatus Thiothrix anitrata]